MEAYESCEAPVNSVCNNELSAWTVECNGQTLNKI